MGISRIKLLLLSLFGMVQIGFKAFEDGQLTLKDLKLLLPASDLAEDIYASFQKESLKELKAEFTDLDADEKKELLSSLDSELNLKNKLTEEYILRQLEIAILQADLIVDIGLKQSDYSSKDEIA